MLREQSVVLYPEDLSLLGDVFDRAVASIPTAMRTSSNRTAIARSILMQAAAGERNPIKLEQAALMKVAVTADPNGFDPPGRDQSHAVLSRKLHTDYLRRPQSARRMVETRARHR